MHHFKPTQAAYFRLYFHISRVTRVGISRFKSKIVLHKRGPRFAELRV
uniref:Uncharacterized protein n=1 Tax=Anguilla anguilla TaxID=7936 RepID=A0A0E9UMR1_ANGAN